MTVFILRHGQTEWNLAGRMQGRRDSPLTERGRDQAARQGAILAGLSLPADTRYVTSPQGRARATAAMALAGLCARPESDARLCEVSLGAYEGLTHAEITARDPALIAAHPALEWSFHCPGGERLGEMQARVAAFLADLTGPTVIVTHGITSRFLRAALLGCDWRGLGDPEGGQGVVFEIANGSQRRHPPLP